VIIEFMDNDNGYIAWLADRIQLVEATPAC